MPHSHKGGSPLSLEPDNRTMRPSWRRSRAKKSACLSQDRRQLVEGQRLQLASAPGGIPSEAGREPGPEVRSTGLGGQLAVGSVEGVMWKRAGAQEPLGAA